MKSAQAIAVIAPRKMNGPLFGSLVNFPAFLFPPVPTTGLIDKSNNIVTAGLSAVR